MNTLPPLAPENEQPRYTTGMRIGIAIRQGIEAVTTITCGVLTAAIVIIVMLLPAAIDAALDKWFNSPPPTIEQKGDAHRN